MTQRKTTKLPDAGSEKRVRVIINVPPHILEQIDAEAARIGTTRSTYFVLAAQAAVEASNRAG